MFAICRTEKFKSWTTLTKSVGHSMRTSADDRQHLNPSAPESVCVLAGSADWLDPWKTQVAGMHLRGLPLGQAHTLAREFFLGMSPQWAEGKTRQEIDEWAAANVAWLNDRFGEDRVKLAVLHLDEQSPHVAAYVTALKADTNRAGEVRTDRGNGWTLSDSSLGLGGSKDGLVKLQDDYSAAMQRFDLARGRRHSKAKHQTVAAWRKQMAEPLPAIRMPKAPEATMADRFDIAAYGKRATKAAAVDIFRQFKPMQQQAKAAPALRRQIEKILAEMPTLRESIAALKGQRDFLSKALAMILGFEPDLSTQQGMARAVADVGEARRRLRGDEPTNAIKAALGAPCADGGNAARPSTSARAPRPGRGPT